MKERDKMKHEKIKIIRKIREELLESLEAEVSDMHHDKDNTRYTEALKKALCADEDELILICNNTEVLYDCLLYTSPSPRDS